MLTQNSMCTIRRRRKIQKAGDAMLLHNAKRQKRDSDRCLRDARKTPDRIFPDNFSRSFVKWFVSVSSESYVYSCNLLLQRWGHGFKPLHAYKIV